MNEDQAPETPATVAVAKLDADGVYQGLDAIPVADVTDTHVLLPDGCDLPPGKYLWSREKSTFLPLASPQQRAVEAPVALNALAWGLLAMDDAGLRLSRPCLDWLDYYIRTIDFGIPGVEVDGALLAAYQEKRSRT
jgi:hypothetical protein